MNIEIDAYTHMCDMTGVGKWITPSTLHPVHISCGVFSLEFPDLPIAPLFSILQRIETSEAF